MPARNLFNNPFHQFGHSRPWQYPSGNDWGAGLGWCLTERCVNKLTKSSFKAVILGPRLLLIWDGSPIHRRASIKEFLARREGRGIHIERPVVRTQYAVLHSCHNESRKFERPNNRSIGSQVWLCQPSKFFSFVHFDCLAHVTITLGAPETDQICVGYASPVLPTSVSRVMWLLLLYACACIGCI